MKISNKVPGVKVCFVSREMISPPVEGNHIASRRFIEAAEGAGIETRILTVEQDKKQNIPPNWNVVNTVLKPSANDAFLPRVTLAVNDMLTAVRLSSLVKSSDCPLVHVLNVSKEAYLLAHSLLRNKKLLLMHFFHSAHTLNDDIFAIRNLAFRAGLYGRIMDNHVLTINLSLAKFLVEKTGVRPENVHYVPYPINTSTFRPRNNKEKTREKYNLPSDCPIVAYVGSLSPARGLSYLIKSFKQVLSSHPRTLLYISYPRREGERIYEQQLRELVCSLEYRDNIVIDAPSPTVQDLYNLADIVALPFTRPYWVDPPLVLLEAMSSGAVVVSTHVGALDEVLRDHENALVVNPENTSSLANAIIEILDNPNLALKLARKARETIIRNYSYQVVGKNLLKVYASILK